MPGQTDFWGGEHRNEWIVFHDESLCKDENFLYHGFLFISREEGRPILETLFDPLAENDRYEKRVHFNEISGSGTPKALIASRWLDLMKSDWLPNNKAKYYVLGINLKNINPDLYNTYHKDKVYVRFYEIGLKGAISWFKINPAQVTHLFYDQGKKDIERYNKSIIIFPHSTSIQPLHSDYLVSRNEMSKLLQLTDVVLGAVRRTFTEIGKSRSGQRKCVETFYEVVTRFNNHKKAYRRESRFWKKFCINFFPANNHIPPKEFFERGLEYHKRAKNLFYCDKLTYEEKKGREKQKLLF